MNDIEGHPINEFPVIKFFPGKEKGKEYTFEEERTETRIAKFIKDKSSYKVEMPNFEVQNDGMLLIDDL